jgi:hypothetical protein
MYPQMGKLMGMIGWEGGARKRVCYVLRNILGVFLQALRKIT